MIGFNSETNTFSSSYINDAFYVSGFATRQVGDGKSMQTIFQFLDANEIPYTNVVVLGQIHSSNISVYRSKGEYGVHSFEKIEDTDGVITAFENIVLIVRTADCVPIIFADKKKGIIGISHQGWRGSLKRLAQKMVSAMEEEGCDIENIYAAIGPSIGECCYTISDDRYYTFLEEFNGYSDKIFFLRKGVRHLNLPLLNYLLLQEVGVLKKHIDFFPFCTSCDEARFFSFRRDRKKGKYQEMMNFVVRRQTNIP